MIITLLNGTAIDVESLGLKRLNHNIPSLDIEHVNVNIEGRGQVVVDSYFTNRVITAEFLFNPTSITNYYTMRDTLNNAFSINEEFYITFKKEPNKRWRVRLNKQFNIPATILMGSFTLEFITTQKYAEDVVMTTRSGNGDSFTIVNNGNAIIDPRENFLEIRMLFGSLGSSTNGVLTNTTTGETFTIRGPLTTATPIMLSGINVTRAELPAYELTNGGLISLAPGINQFTASGGGSRSFTFSYRNLYK